MYYINDYKNKAVNTIIPYLISFPDIVKMVELHAERYQNIEDVIWKIIDNLNLDNSSGIFLKAHANNERVDYQYTDKAEDAFTYARKQDIITEDNPDGLVNPKKNAYNTGHYYSRIGYLSGTKKSASDEKTIRSIKSKIIQNNTDGRIDDLKEGLKMLYNAERIRVLESYPLNVKIMLIGDSLEISSSKNQENIKHFLPACVSLKNIFIDENLFDLFLYDENSNYGDSRYPIKVNDSIDRYEYISFSVNLDSEFKEYIQTNSPIYDNGDFCSISGQFTKLNDNANILSFQDLDNNLNYGIKTKLKNGRYYLAFNNNGEILYDEYIYDLTNAIKGKEYIDGAILQEGEIVYNGYIYSGATKVKKYYKPTVLQDNESVYENYVYNIANATQLDKYVDKDTLQENQVVYKDYVYDISNAQWWGLYNKGTILKDNEVTDGNIVYKPFGDVIPYEEGMEIDKNHFVYNGYVYDKTQCKAITWYYPPDKLNENDIIYNDNLYRNTEKLGRAILQEGEIVYNDYIYSDAIKLHLYIPETTLQPNQIIYNNDNNLDVDDIYTIILSYRDNDLYIYFVNSVDFTGKYNRDVKNIQDILGKNANIIISNFETIDSDILLNCEKTQTDNIEYINFGDFTYALTCFGNILQDNIFTEYYASCYGEKQVLFNCLNNEDNLRIKTNNPLISNIMKKQKFYNYKVYHSGNKYVYLDGKSGINYYVLDQDLDGVIENFELSFDLCQPLDEKVCTLFSNLIGDESQVYIYNAQENGQNENENDLGLALGFSYKFTDVVNNKITELTFESSGTTVELNQYANFKLKYENDELKFYKNNELISTYNVEDSDQNTVRFNKLLSTFKVGFDENLTSPYEGIISNINYSAKINLNNVNGEPEYRNINLVLPFKNSIKDKNKTPFENLGARIITVPQLINDTNQVDLYNKNLMTKRRSS